MKLEKIKQLRKFYKDALFNDVLPFWMKSDLIDKEHGGFITSVDREGKSYNDDKSVWFQGRCLWTFSKLCNVYGVNEEWAKAADEGAKFIKEHCIDTDGRMFFTVTRDGKPLRKRRYFYSESFLVVGFAEYYLLRGRKEDLALAEEYFDLMYRLYRDPASDPFKITPKESDVRSLRSNAYPMVLVSSAQTLKRASGKNEYYDKIISDVIADMINLHYKEEYKCVLETVYTDGSILDTPAGRTINPGHSIENSWFLMNYSALNDNETLQKQALNILDWSLDIGWDKEFDGIYYFRDLYGRPCEQLEYDMKLWWVHNETLIATLVAHFLTGDEKYEQWYDKAHEYSFSHFSDKECGEWYGYLHKDGTVSHTQKGSMWKGPFHYPRMLMNMEMLFEHLEKGEQVVSLL